MKTSTLYRSRTERMVSGVCGGLGKALGLDATLVRLFFILLTLANGIGFLLYLVLMILMPSAPEEDNPAAPVLPFWENSEAIRLGGISLVVVGIIALIGELDLPQLAWANTGTLWPAMLVLGGVVLLVRALKA